MKLLRLAGGACVALLACGCATRGAVAPPVRIPIEVSLGEADTAVRAGQTEKAVGILAQAAQAHPEDKAPWLRMAQLQYDRGQYGPAIVQAQAALLREPDNLLAHSIVAVSGLRVASKALADLARRHNLTGTVRGEAEDLARLLRTSLGEDTLIAAPERHDAPPPHRRAPVSSHAGRDASASDPFGALK